MFWRRWPATAAARYHSAAFQAPDHVRAPSRRTALRGRAGNPADTGFAGRSHLRMHIGWRDMSNGGLPLVHPAGDHLAFALLHGVIALLGDEGGAVLLGGADLGIHHVGAFEEFGFGGARHQTGNGDPAI